MQCRNKHSKTQGKGQMEIMGLAIIIILVVLALLFTLHFVRQESQERSIPDSLMANMFVSTYLDTTVPDCSNVRIKDLLKDCGQSNSMVCPSGKTACQQAEGVTKRITSSYEKILHRHFNLIIQGPQNLQAMSIRVACSGERESSKPFIVPTIGGTGITVRFEICEK